MFIRKFLDGYRTIWNQRGDDKDFKRSILLLFSTYFFTLFSYPLARSANSGIFYEFYTSDFYPMATFYTVVSLSLVVSSFNLLQKYIGAHKLYLVIGVLTVVSFGVSLIGSNAGIKEFALLLFATKEIYIVLLIHVAMAFCNGYFSLDDVKSLYGPLGAVGSVGGILGGQLTRVVGKAYGTTAVLIFSSISVLMAVTLFYQTRHIKLIKSVKNKYELSPLASIRPVIKYVFLIGLLIALSQFVIFIADLQFNMVFSEAVPDKNARTSFSGTLYSLVNGGSLLVQIFVLPFIMTRFQTRHILYFVPLFYILLVLIGPVFGLGGLYAFAGIYVGMKSTDYSLFNVVREVLYYPLSNLQKYGAKYITDVLIYRVAKGGLALALSFWSTKTVFSLNLLQAVFLTLWIIGTYAIILEHKKSKMKVD